MHLKLKTIFFLIILINPLLLFSQKEYKLAEFIQQIKNSTESFKKQQHFSKARTFFIQNQWDSTLTYTKKYLSNSLTDKVTIDYCHFFRGYSFYKKEIFNEANKEFQSVSKKFKFHHSVTAYLGAIALESDKYEKALNYFKEIENIPKDSLLIISEERIKDNIGISYLHLQKFAEATPYLLQSVKVQTQAKDTIQLVSSYGNLANLFYLQYKDTQAIPYFEKAYLLAKTTDHFKSKQNTAQNMSVVEENRKDYKKALQYRKEHEQWTDSINDQNKIYATAKAEEKIAVEKEQKQVAVLKAKNEVQEAQRNTYLYSAIILLLLLVASFYFYREKVKANTIINAQKEDLNELNATKDKLFSIVSHDLRSSVNAIKTSNTKLVDKLETENLTEVNSLLQNNSSIVNGAYNLLDNLLNWAMLQTKQSYFEVSKLRLFQTVAHVAYNYKAMLADKEISFENNVDKKAVVFADQESLKIILRNLIDNAIKFSNPKGNIHIYTENKNEDFCDLIIEDEGIGMDNETRKELLKETVLLSKKKHENIIGTGLGMQLCKSMIKKNNGTFSIESKLGKGTKMIISLPKNLPNEPH